ncbi:prepilin peptidase [Streptomyces sp. NPDC060053]|uniref:prepilin peptidase n=1 Tax=Streptomyces sp. NPDC060053 TaxID=3347047 RepID=UPI003692C463
MTTPPSDLALVTIAALWGALAGALLPRAVHRFSVPWEERDGGWRATCPDGHPIRGWLGRARCDRCAKPGQGLRSGPGSGSGSGPGSRSESESGRESGPGSESGSGPGPRSGSGPEPGPGSGPGPGPGSESESGSGPGSESGSEPGPGPGSGPGAESGPGPEPGSEPGPGPGPRSDAPGVVGLSLLAAVVCGALAAATGVRPELVVWLLLAPAGVLLAAVDLRVRRLPDPLTLPLAAAALALLGPAALLPEHAGDWTTALLGALALGGGYLVLHLVNPGGMAYGDVKLALSMGAVLGWYGWATVMLGTFAAFLLGALYGGALAVVGRAGRGTTIAFGPFMLVGTLAGLLIGAYAA